MMENSRVNTMADMKQRNVAHKESHSSPTIFTIQNWIDNICIPISEDDFDTCRRGSVLHNNTYTEDFNTYLYEFENC